MQWINSLLSQVVTNAYAEPAGSQAVSGQQGSGLSFIIMLAFVIIFIYVAIWRPQSKRAKEQQNLLNSLAKGDEIVTVGGVLGKIVDIADPYITVAFTENVDVIMQKSSVASVLPKGTMKNL